MEDNVGKIKERLNIADVISGYIKLQKSGVNFKARCPFHNEKSGSFYVSSERQIWHCFGCGLGGDMFSFVQQMEGLDFPETLRILAGKAGVELSSLPVQSKNNKSVLYEICELASKFFEKQLWESHAGKYALQYLYDRGVTDASIASFRLGYAPDMWQGLGEFLLKRYALQDIFDAGLIIKKDNGGWYERFRGRIMFPIADTNGQTVGFSGRIFQNPQSATKIDESVAKYINTPQGPIYDKSKLLFGFDKAKADLRKGGRCLLVEGNLDVVMSHQAGVTRAVATCGTACTPQHLQLIKRYTDTIDLCFDADNAGSMATEKAVNLAIVNGFNINIVIIGDPELKDPADFVKVRGEEWQEHSTKSVPFLDFYFNDLRKKHDIATASGKKEFTNKMLPFVASMQHHVEQAHWISEIALLLKLSEAFIKDEVRLLAQKLPPKLSTVMDMHEEGPNMSNIQETSVHLDPLEETLLSLLVKKPDLVHNVSQYHNNMLSPLAGSLIEQIRALVAQGTTESAVLMQQLAEPHNAILTMSLEFVYLKSQELWLNFSEKDITEEFQRLLSQMKKTHIATKLDHLKYDIQMAERSRDRERLTILLQQFAEVSRELI